MFDSIKNALSQLVTFSVQTAKSIVKTSTELPKTMQRIQRSNRLNFFINNSLLIDWLYFALPLLTSQYVITKIHEEEPDNPHHSATAFIAQTLTSSIYLLLWMRLSLENKALHTTAIVSANSLLQEDYKDDIHLQNPAFCKDCKTDGDRFRAETSFILHYLVGSAGIYASQTAVEYLPVVGSSLSLLLEIYWRGFVAFQYPLASKVCAEHQIHILKDNKSVLMGYGLVFTGLDRGLTVVSKLILHDSAAARVLSIAISNSLVRIGMLHAYQMSSELRFETKSKQKCLDSLDQFDPIILCWLLSVTSTQKATLAIRSTLQQDGKTGTLWLQTKEAFFQLRNNIHQASWYPLAQVLGMVIVPTNLRSVEAFAKTKAIQPYVERIVHDLEPLIKTANDVTDRMVTKAFISLIRVPLIGSMLISAGTHYTNSQTGISREFIKAFARFLQSTDVKDSLVWLEKEITKYKPSTSNSGSFGTAIAESRVHFFSKQKPLLFLKENYISHLKKEQEPESMGGFFSDTNPIKLIDNYQPTDKARKTIIDTSKTEEESFDSSWELLEETPELVNLGFFKAKPLGQETRLLIQQRQCHTPSPTGNDWVKL